MKSVYQLSIVLMLSLLGLTKLHSQDWADLNRFKEANNNLPEISDNENRIVFMGNSITIGWLNSRPEFFKGKPYINRGISGQTTPQMLIRFRQDVIDLNPKAVVLLAGTNDIAGNTGPSTIAMIMDNIKGMAEIATANDIKVILTSTLPAYDYPWKPGLEPAEKIIALNKLIKEYCDDKGHIYVDYFSAMADEKNGLPKKYAEDGVHPTVEGYKIMEPLVEAAIEQALTN
ncbi:SGNH/GDSL hydrolase family protein [Maribacter sp. MAR_2009_72]|uniref:SGNH/GDSL hydrolase family protein n=1 Tax=Maribacter sp. MAR_2009_72 TaxID=1250050 RepID=UPI00119C2AB8|nr:SGNH/GDSL hydrolase family protein [Maribacter sp. MAR_2009_72]TVZ14123.1 lysophospholipase L1-like esterase [Maribacter sp. MAR_2009_72]